MTNVFRRTICLSIYLSSLSFPPSLPQFHYTLLYPLFMNYLFYSVIFAVICCCLQSMVCSLLCVLWVCPPFVVVNLLCAYIHTFATSYVLHLPFCSLPTSLLIPWGRRCTHFIIPLKNLVLLEFLRCGCGRLPIEVDRASSFT